jgi:hypothetical protein
MYARPANEATSLGYLMGACFLTYVAQWPYLARQAHLGEFNLQTSLAASLLAWLLIAPLLLYTLAIVLYFFHKIFKGSKSSAQIRMGFFWSFLAATPIMMLLGLVKGFLGDGTAESIVGLFWFVALCYFIFCAVLRAHVGGAFR